MSDAIVVMDRYELKYVLTKEQIGNLIQALDGHMKVDKYGKTSIASLYYDTADSRLIRKSLEKPKFREKIRLRSYGLATGDKPVFLELKRKAYGIVYKRRVETKVEDVNDFFDYKLDHVADGQIAKEITYFRNYYGKLVPSCLIIYDRVAYFEEEGDLRLTIDYNPRYRIDNLTLDYSMEGTSPLKDGEAILEVKVQDSVPLWLSHILDKYKIYNNSFSKYGKAYESVHKMTKEERGMYYVWFNFQ